MIERVEFSDNNELNLYRIKDILNHVVDRLNGMNTPLPTPMSKWKLGDISWYVNLFESGCSNDWKIKTTPIDNFLLEEYHKGDLNIFKTKEQAEACLAEIKKVMRKYQ